MSSVKVLIQHNGRWDSINNYVGFSVDAIAISTNSNFEDLVTTISRQIGIDRNIQRIEIKYKFNPTSPSLEIHNDMGVQVYMEIKQENKDLSLYPLCISIKDDSSAQQNLEDESVVRSLVHSDNMSVQDMYTEDNLKLIQFGECVEDDEICSGEIISDPMHKEVAAGQVYENKKILKSVMNLYAVREKFQFKVERSCSKSYYLVCKGSNCCWEFRASWLNGTEMFRIRTFVNEHTCSIKDRCYTLRQATSSVIGHMIKYKYNDPRSTYNPRDIMLDMKESLGIDIPYMKAWRAKEQALKMLRGDPTESYNKLPGYLYLLEINNPGSIVDLVRTDDNCFLYCFVALYASIKGWEYCRPIVVVDGSFLTGAFKGTFLASSTIDAAGKVLPLAYAIVDSENDASWEYFFNRFKEAYGEREDMCVVSDRKESIIKASSIVYPRVPHYACIWHLWNNVKSKFKGNNKALHKVFFKMAKAYTIQEFDKCMKKVEKIDVRVKEYLYKIGYEKWSRAHSSAKRGYTMTSNIAESLNSANRHAKDMPITAFVDYLHGQLEFWFNRSREKAKNTFTTLGKKYNKILNDHRLLALEMTVKRSSDVMYSVYHRNTRFRVSLEGRTCCCRSFQMDELPCPHACAVLRSINIDEEDFASLYYTKDNLEKIYELHVNPLPNEESWNIPEYILNQKVLPLLVKNKQDGQENPGSSHIGKEKIRNQGIHVVRVAKKGTIDQLVGICQ